MEKIEDWKKMFQFPFPDFNLDTMGSDHASPTGLPDFSWYNLPKRVKIYQITIKCTKRPQNIRIAEDRPKGNIMYQYLS
jgi:hypothetical protein